MMDRAFRTILIAFTLLPFLTGCSKYPEKMDVKKDAMDPQSLKALENPPPGMPGAPPPKDSKQVPGMPSTAGPAPGPSTSPAQPESK
jgi:hypothetical protein